MNSLRMLTREEGSAFAIVDFSVRHVSHFRVQPLWGRALEAISQRYPRLYITEILIFDVNCMSVLQQREN